LDVMLQQTYSGWGGNFVGQPWAALVLAALALSVLSGLLWMGFTDEDTGKGKRPVTGNRDDPEVARTPPADPLVSRAIQAFPGRILGVFRGRDQARYDDRDVAVLVAWMLLPQAGIWLLSTRQPLFVNRYLIWAAPAFYLLAAAGWVALGRLGWRGALVAVGLSSVVLVGDAGALVYQGTQPIKADFRAVAEHLQARYQPDDLIVFHISYMAQSFDYYYDSDFTGWGAPAAADGRPGPDFDAQMRNNTEGYGTLWLVLSEAEMWDPQGLVKAWLDDHALTPPDERVFTEVRVYRYQLNR
jgi:hypothetical protein